MDGYSIPFSRFALRWAIYFLLACLIGGVVAYPLAGIGAIYVTLALGLIVFSFLILFELVLSPYKLLMGDDGITLFFRLKPSEFIYYVEMDGVPLSLNENKPVLKLKGRRRVYDISFDAAKEISRMIKIENSMMSSDC